MDLNSVPSTNDGFFDVLDTCCKQIVQKMGNKPITEWRMSDYNSLSSQLGKQTKVYLSENTLKRIFGRLKTSKRYYPQKATRDALAQFIGYRDWQEFELVQHVSGDQNAKESKKAEVASTVDEPIEDTKEEKPFKSLRTAGVALLACVLIAACLIYIFRENYIDPTKVSLICENPVGQVPHTAVFRLSSDHVFDGKQKFEIDFMDEAAPVEISGEKEVTQFFRNPGVVYVKLRYKGVAVDTVAVQMQTKGWVANSGNDSTSAFPIAKLQTLSKDNIFVSAKQLDSAGLNLAKPFLVGFSNIHSSKISGDDFQFSCNLQTEESRPGVQCIESTIIILGEKSRHLVTLYKPSCAAFSEYQFSELKVNGSSKYLGAMGFDFKDGGEVKLMVRNKKVQLFISGKKVLETSYNLAIGKVMGIKVLFNGIGRLRNPILEDLQTKAIY